MALIWFFFSLLALLLNMFMLEFNGWMLNSNNYKVKSVDLAKKKYSTVCLLINESNGPNGRKLSNSLVPIAS